MSLPRQPFFFYLLYPSPFLHRNNNTAQPNPTQPNPTQKIQRSTNPMCVWCLNTMRNGVACITQTHVSPQHPPTESDLSFSVNFSSSFFFSFFCFFPALSQSTTAKRVVTCRSRLAFQGTKVSRVGVFKVQNQNQSRTVELEPADYHSLSSPSESWESITHLTATLL